MLPSPRRARGPPAAARRRIPAMDQPPSAAAYDAEAADQPLTAAQALLLHWEAAWSQRAPGRGVPSALLRAAGGARGLALLSLLFSLLSTALALAAPMLLRARLASGGAHLGVAGGIHRACRRLLQARSNEESALHLRRQPAGAVDRARAARCQWVRIF
jgi:hypothetical protein